VRHVPGFGVCPSASKTLLKPHPDRSAPSGARVRRRRDSGSPPGALGFLAEVRSMRPLAAPQLST